MKNIKHLKRVFAISVIFLLAANSFVFIYAGEANAFAVKPCVSGENNTKISNDLMVLVDKEAQAKSFIPGVFGRYSPVFTSQKTTAVIEFKDGASVSSFALLRYGAVIKRKYGNYFKVEIPVKNLKPLAEAMPGIKFIRKPYKPIPVETSQGVGLTGASLFKSIGYNGKGVKIAVIDGGFDGLTEAVANGDLPAAGIITQDYTTRGMEAAVDGVHGTGVAEIIYDMAPQAQLYLLKIDDSIDLGVAKDYCKANGIKIINHSMGWFNSGPGDGTGIICDIANDAKANDILWVNSAGNHAQKHWQGMFTTTLASGVWQDPPVTGDTYRVHEFISGDEESQSCAISATLGQVISAYMRWDDWPNTAKSYGLFLYDKDPVHDNTAIPVDGAAYIQNGTQPPLVGFSYTVPATGTYYLAAISINLNVSDNVEIEIYSAAHDLEYKTASSSILEPSDATGVFTAGAISQASWTTGPQETFSSQGPTNAWASSSARIKPDIAGVDGVSNYTYGTFWGTSASGPHVAAAAALLASIFPDMNADQLQAKLGSESVDMGDVGKDNIYGQGRLNLPDPAVILADVVINEFVPNATNEWVELYNKGSEDINISGCFIDDKLGTIGSSDPQKISDGTIIQAGKYYVYDLGSGYLNNSGDDIYFIAPDGTTVIDKNLSFADSTNHSDQSIYRLPDGGSWASDFDDTPTKGAANNGPAAKGSIKFTVLNRSGAATADAHIVIYDPANPDNILYEAATASDGTYTFNNNLSPATYGYEVYYPSSDPTVRRLWAAGSAAVSSGQTANETAVQTMPYITNISIKDSIGNPVTTIEAGKDLIMEVTVKNGDAVTRTAYPEIFIDDNKAGAYVHSDSKSSSPQSLAQNSSAVFTFTYTVPTSIADQTTEYLNVTVETIFGSKHGRTDMSDWSKSFIVSNTAKGSIKFTVLNRSGAATADAHIVIYDPANPDNILYEAATASDGTYTFNNNLSPATYGYEVYYPSSDPTVRRLWAAGSTVVSSGLVADITVTQVAPYIKSVSVKDTSNNPKTIFARGDIARISVEVQNDDALTLNTYPDIKIDADKVAPFYAELTKSASAVNIASGASVVFNFDFTIPCNATYGETFYINSIVYSKYSINYSRTDVGNWNWFLQIENPANQPPIISNGSVNPASADLGAEFMFSVDYLDNEDNVPAVKNVVINGQVYDMTLESGDAYNGVYVFKTYLWQGSSHEYHFEFSDGQYPVRLPVSGEYSGPVVTLQGKTAVLFNPQLDKRVSDINSTYTFSIYYFDETAGAPSSAELILDGVPRVLILSNGSVGSGTYSYSTILTESDTHSYYFEFVDSLGKTVLRFPSQGELNEPVVTKAGGADELLVDDFNDAQTTLNSLGFVTDDDSACAVNADVAGAHQITWNDTGDYWYSCFAASPNFLQAKKYNAVSFKIKSDTINPSVFLRLRNINRLYEDVPLGDYSILDNTWRVVEVPLSDFAYKGLELGEVFSLQIVSGQPSGTVYIDDIKLKYDPLFAPITNAAYSATIKLPSAGDVQVIGGNLYVAGQPFLVKAVGYQPVPIGNTSGTWNRSDIAIYDRDFPLIKSMGANTIKTWSDVSSAMMAKADQYDVRVVAGFYVEGALNLSDVNTRNTLKNDFRNYVNAYKDSPALFAWSVGGEQNLLNGDNPEWYTLANELAQIAYEEEGLNYHPVLIDNADISNIGYVAKSADDISLSYVDIWGVAFYRGRTIDFGFSDIADRTHKPVFVSEFGIDAYDNNAVSLDEDSQAWWDKDIWNEIATAGNSAGGSIMEYSDEWWKDPSGSASQHDTGGAQLLAGSMPDDFANEEYFGVVSIQDDGVNPDKVFPRPAYSLMQERFSHSTRDFVNITRPAAPQNLNATVSVNDINLTWSGVSGPNIAGYNIYRSNSKDSGLVRLNSAPITNLFYQDTVSPGFVYFYAVCAVTTDHIRVESESSAIKMVNMGGNLAPDLDPLPNQVTDEDVPLDNAIDLWAYASDDIDTDDLLQFSIVSNTNPDTGVSIDSNRYIDINPAKDFSGSSDVVIKVIDTGGLSAQRQFKVTVNPVNDPPTISGVPDLQLTEDIAYEFDVFPYIDDPDNERATLVVTENSNYATVIGHRITFNYPNGVTSQQVEITVSDGVSTASQVITVNITPVNDPPVFDAVSDKTVDEGVLFSFAVNATDIDSAILSYSAAGLPDGATFNFSTRTFNWTPSYLQGRLQPYTVTFNVSDGIVSVSISVNITVNNVVLPPAPPTASIVSITPNPVELGGSVTFAAAATSGANNQITAYEWSSNIDGVFLSATSAIASFSGLSAGVHTITLRVKNDADLWSTPVTGFLQVVANPVVITSPANSSSVSGIVSVSALANMSTIENMYLYVDSSSVAADNSSPYTFLWNTANSSNGIHALKVRASYSYYETYDVLGIIPVSVKKTRWIESVPINVIVNNSTPGVRITSPADGDTVNGAVSFQATAPGASFAYYYIDGRWSGVVFNPYGYNWNTLNTANGAHSIYIKAFYASQLRWVTSSVITVNVNN